MKLAILTLALFTGICFSSCQKETVTPKGTDTKTTGTNPPLTQTSLPAVDTVKGYLRIQLAKDAANTDNILINFKPAANAAYVVNEDAPYLKGMGAVNLSSLSADSKACAINALPLTTQGRSVALNVNASADGAYKLNIMTIQSIPANFSIYLKDNYLRDSVNFRTSNSYAFNIAAADTATYGSNRFSIVLHKN